MHPVCNNNLALTRTKNGSATQDSSCNLPTLESTDSVQLFVVTQNNSTPQLLSSGQERAPAFNMCWFYHCGPLLTKNLHAACSGWAVKRAAAHFTKLPAVSFVVFALACLLAICDRFQTDFSEFEPHTPMHDRRRTSPGPSADPSSASRSWPAKLNLDPDPPQANHRPTGTGGSGTTRWWTWPELAVLPGTLPLATLTLVHRQTGVTPQRTVMMMQAAAAAMGGLAAVGSAAAGAGMRRLSAQRVGPWG